MERASLCPRLKPNSRKKRQAPWFSAFARLERVNSSKAIFDNFHHVKKRSITKKKQPYRRKKMRLIIRLLIASLVSVIVLTGSLSRSSADGTILRARAVISGVDGSGISGEV